MPSHVWEIGEASETMFFTWCKETLWLYQLINFGESSAVVVFYIIESETYDRKLTTKYNNCYSLLFGLVQGNRFYSLYERPANWAKSHL